MTTYFCKDKINRLHFFCSFALFGRESHYDKKERGWHPTDTLRCIGRVIGRHLYAYVLGIIETAKRAILGKKVQIWSCYSVIVNTQGNL